MAVAPVRRRLHRLEPTALRGVMVREVVNFSSFWRSSTFSSTVDPTIYLLAFGFGFGSLVSTVAGYDYIDFVGTGIVATTVLFAGAFPAMYSTFVKYEFQHTYDAILAAPVDTEEIVTGEALWIAARVGVYGMAPILVGIVFGHRVEPERVRPGRAALRHGELDDDLRRGIRREVPHRVADDREPLRRRRLGRPREQSALERLRARVRDRDQHPTDLTRLVTGGLCHCQAAGSLCAGGV